MIEAELDRLLGCIADGRSVDWDAQRTRTIDPEDAAMLDALRVVYDMRVASARGAVSHWKDLSGSSWGPYLLVERLGEGGFGAVYRARDRWLQNEVALKVLHAGDRARLREEGVKLAGIRHPNVIEVITIIEEGGEPALAMRLIEGETLTAVTRTRHLDVREAALLAEDVCRALAKVHAAGIIHCDIKAGNVMRARDGRVILMDFGAGVPGTGDGPVRLEGTPPYMAPEIFATRTISQQSDIYAVGVLLFYLVTGEYPVEGRTFEDYRAAHAAGRRRRLVDVRPDLSPDFRQIVERALSPDPAKRFRTAGEMQEALEALRRGRSPRIPKKVTVSAQVILALVLYCAAIGLLSAHYLNFALGRSGFDHELDASKWLIYGFRAQALPATLVIIGLATASVLSAACNIVGSSRLARTPPCALVARGWNQTVRFLGLHDTATAPSSVLVLSAAGFGIVLWLFRDLIRALFVFVSTEDASVLAWLSTDYCDAHEMYQASLIVLAGLSIAGWYYVRRLSSRASQPPGGSLQAGGVAIIVLTLLLLYVPYLMLNHNDFEMAMWNGDTCYNIGHRDDDLLLFCPNSDVPRNHNVKRAEVTLLAKKESLLWRFSAPGSTRTMCYATTTPPATSR